MFDTLSDLTIREIKEALEEVDFLINSESILLMEKDGRTGVHKLAETCKKAQKHYRDEQIRLKEMFQYEFQAMKKGYSIIGGIDEAGRGPLAGPVAAAIVVLPKKCTIKGIDDSKKLSSHKREELFHIISKSAIEVQTGLATAEEIDKINILNATKLAIERALSKTKTKPDFLLVDCLRLPKIKIPQQSIINGDCLSVSIAAASIVAKVTRDALMIKYSEEFPQYGFHRHKGYGCKIHIDAISRNGPSTLHRLTFRKIGIGQKKLIHSKSFHQFTSQLNKVKDLITLKTIGSEIAKFSNFLPYREIKKLRILYKNKKNKLCQQ